MQDVRSEATSTNDHVSPFERTDGTRQFEEFQSLLQRQRLHAEFTGQLGKLWLDTVFSRTNLHDGTEAAYLGKYGTTALGVLTQFALTGLMLLTGIQRLVHYRFKALVESLHHTRPFLFALGNLIEVMLHLGSEVIVHDFLEVIHQEVVHHDTDICRQQFSLIRADQFLANRLLGWKWWGHRLKGDRYPVPPTCAPAKPQYSEQVPG